MVRFQLRVQSETRRDKSVVSLLAVIELISGFLYVLAVYYRHWLFHDSTMVRGGMEWVESLRLSKPLLHEGAWAGQKATFPYLTSIRESLNV